MGFSLNQVMNDIAQAGVEPILQQLPSPLSLSMTDEDAFSHFDDLFANLQKKYHEAKAQRQELERMYGKSDPMVVVALDIEDSSWCAMQTRYLELRMQRDMVAKAQAFMRHQANLHYEKKKEDLKIAREKRATELYYFWSMIDIVNKKRNKTSVILEWLALYLWFNIDILGSSRYKKNTLYVATV